ncbi:MAG: DUF2113 family protein [Comamonadaceae bacterium]|nr:DUF2113 family protein [Comamonadaceae bacterium]
MEVFKIEVTGQEEFGAKKYRELIMDILQDLGLIRSIGKLYVYVDIMKPFFAVYGLLRSGIPPLTVKDVGDVMKVQGGYQVKINDEEHMADLLRALMGALRPREGGAAGKRYCDHSLGYIALRSDGDGPGGRVPAGSDRCPGQSGTGRLSQPAQ